MNSVPTLDDIRRAAERIKPYAHHTPVLTSRSINRLTGAEIFFKCENFQKAGAFKFRGACNAIFSLEESERSRGVATHSSGNHAAALSLAAGIRGCHAYIVMPRNAPAVKQAAVREYGGNIIFCESTYQSRQDVLARVVAETGAVFIHPFNDYRIITGQGTAALELLEEVPHLDIVMTPVGGGGLLSGTAIAVSELSPDTQIIGAEPLGADDAYRSFVSGAIQSCTDPHTIADGLRTAHLGDLTFPIIRQRVQQIITVSDESIIAAMRHVWERMKIIIEPSAGVPLAAIFERGADFQGKRIGIVLSGGNVDFDSLPWQHRG